MAEVQRLWDFPGADRLNGPSISSRSVSLHDQPMKVREVDGVSIDDRHKERRSWPKN